MKKTLNAFSMLLLGAVLLLLMSRVDIVLGTDQDQVNIAFPKWAQTSWFELNGAQHDQR
jgi:hypothetical protein